MNEDNENNETNGNGEEEQVATTYIVPDFPLRGDKPEYDYFLSQYIGALYRAGLGQDGNFWFHRVIGYSGDVANPYPYAFTLDGQGYTMKHIMSLISDKSLVFNFISIGTPQYNGNTATIEAEVEIVDNRAPTPRPTRKRIEFRHTIRPTQLAYQTDIVYLS
jgi:hypothetical protein